MAKDAIIINPEQYPLLTITHSNDYLIVLLTVPHTRFSGHHMFTEKEFKNIDCWDDISPNLYKAIKLCRLTTFDVMGFLVAYYENGMAQDQVTFSVYVKSLDWSAVGLSY